MSRPRTSSSRRTRSSNTRGEPSPFALRVYAALVAVPRGKVTTYAALAAAIGNPGAAQAVGNALHANGRPIEVPCHRVVRSDGSVGGYAWGGRKKAAILSEEGVAIVDGKVDLGRYGTVTGKALKDTQARKSRKRI